MKLVFKRESASVAYASAPSSHLVLCVDDVLVLAVAAVGHRQPPLRRFDRRLLRLSALLFLLLVVEVDLIVLVIVAKVAAAPVVVVVLLLLLINPNIPRVLLRLPRKKRKAWAG